MAIVVTARKETKGTTIPAVAVVDNWSTFQGFFSIGRNEGKTGKLSTMAGKDDKSEAHPSHPH